MTFRDIVPTYYVNHMQSRLANSRAFDVAAGSTLPLCESTVLTAVMFILPNSPDDGDNKHLRRYVVM
jgi:hypothetical protein